MKEGKLDAVLYMPMHRKVATKTMARIRGRNFEDEEYPHSSYDT